MLQEHTTPKSAGRAIAELDAPAWDAFVARHPRGHLLQTAGWGALKSRFGWEARRVAVLGAEGALAGAQVLVRHRLGLSVAYVPRGPLLAEDAVTNDVLLSALDRLARRNRAVFLRLEPNLLEGGSDAAALGRLLLAKGFRTAPPIQPHSSIHLDLAPDLARLLAGMRKGHRADIKRAAREGVVVRAGADAADLDSFYAIMEQTGARAKFGIHSRDYYRYAWEVFSPAGAQLFLAEREGRTLAACLIFAAGGEGLYFYGGSTEEGLRSGANHALQWEAIEWARDKGCARYDFWGVPDQFGLALAAADDAERERLEAAAKDDPLYGVFRFKKGFGGDVVRYLPAYDRVYLGPLYALWQRRLGG